MIRNASSTVQNVTLTKNGMLISVDVSVIMWSCAVDIRATWANFQPSAQKTKKIILFFWKKNSLYFEMKANQA